MQALTPTRPPSGYLLDLEAEGPAGLWAPLGQEAQDISKAEQQRACPLLQSPLPAEACCSVLFSAWGIHPEPAILVQEPGPLLFISPPGESATQA